MQINSLNDQDPKERYLLPWFKDPNVKVSIWAIIKDSAGKDISKLSVPVYFNQPTSLLQTGAQQQEYVYILDQACQIKGNDNMDIAKRLAYVAVYSISTITMCEKSASKPFNPLLGETYELITDNMECISEQVSHHPPITATYVRGRNNKFSVQSNQLTKTKFTGKCLDFNQTLKTYIELGDFGEKYQVSQPTVSAHNLIIGTPYVDIGGSSKVELLDGNFECNIKFHKRGWLSKEACKVEGEVSRITKDKKNELLYKIHGNWNSEIFVT